MYLISVSRRVLVPVDSLLLIIGVVNEISLGKHDAAFSEDGLVACFSGWQIFLYYF